jgi:hypothetical protein
MAVRHHELAKPSPKTVMVVVVMVVVVMVVVVMVVVVMVVVVMVVVVMVAARPGLTWVGSRPILLRRTLQGHGLDSSRVRPRPDAHEHPPTLTRDLQE